MTEATLPRAADAVIVGAGFAGASAAAALARRGLGRILLLEAEPVAGVHATGRNAALAYSVVDEPVIRSLARAGLEFLRDPPGWFSGGLDHQFRGSLTLVEPPELATVDALATALRQEGAVVDRWTKAEVIRRVPILRERPGLVGYHCPADGVIDIHGLLQGYLRVARSHGTTIAFRCRAEALLVTGGRVAGIRTRRGEVATPLVLLAGGPWANELAVAAGLPPLPLRPCRRHLAVLERRGWELDPGWPFVWNRTAGFYFRPESGGLLVCACDVEDHAPADVAASESGIATVTERSLELLQGADSALLRTAWAGLRTLTPDHHFVIGPDPALPGLHWVAGLGGHGMTTSAAVGALVADLVLAGRADAVTAAVSPARFRAHDPVSPQTRLTDARL